MGGLPVHSPEGRFYHTVRATVELTRRFGPPVRACSTILLRVKPFRNSVGLARKNNNVLHLFFSDLLQPSNVHGIMTLTFVCKTKMCGRGFINFRLTRIASKLTFVS